MKDKNKELDENIEYEEIDDNDVSDMESYKELEKTWEWSGFNGILSGEIPRNVTVGESIHNSQGYRTNISCVTSVPSQFRCGDSGSGWTPGASGHSGASGYSGVSGT